MYASAAGPSREVEISILTAVGIGAYLVLRQTSLAPEVGSWPLLVVLALGGSALLWSLAQNLIRLEFGSDLLAGIAILSAACMGEYLVACVIVLMLSGGGALEQYATRKASSALDALAKRLPRVAHRETDGEIDDIDIGEIQIGDTLVVFPHEICPVDGSVAIGGGSMDESYLTGEPFLISKAPGSEVISGAVNGESALTIRAGKLPIDSRYARVMRVMQESQQNRPRLRRMADKLAAWYTPLAVLIAVAAAIASHDIHRLLAVLVIATPCPLLIAIPVAVIGAISLCARSGIIIRDPTILEQVDQCKTFIFDKTGTLTYGRPVLTDVFCAPEIGKNEAIRLAATLEQYSRHPLSAAILRAAEEAGVSYGVAEHISEHPGGGLSGAIAGDRIHVTGRAKAVEAGFVSAEELPPPNSGLECVLLVNDRYKALFRFHDEPRQEGKAFLDHLLPKHDVRKLILLSGDRESEVQYMAGIFGIREVFSGMSPEDKVRIVWTEAARAKTLFVGDGINDAPAMLAATAGVAMGQANEATTEAAGAVAIEGKLDDVDRLIHAGRRMRRIALQSAVGGMLLSGVGMVAAATGHLPPIQGAVAQEIIDVLAVLNAVRTGLPRKQATDFR
jgi:heavy metal translocating P-type ATPase